MNNNIRSTIFSLKFMANHQIDNEKFKLILMVIVVACRGAEW